MINSGFPTSLSSQVYKKRKMGMLGHGKVGAKVNGICFFEMVIIFYELCKLLNKEAWIW